MPLNDHTFWLDANLPPKAVQWLSEHFNAKATHIASLNFLTTDDNTIFEAAKRSGESVIIITKDEDFVNLVLVKKGGPKIIWITAGNISNVHLRSILISCLQQAVETLENDHNFFVEIN